MLRRSFAGLCLSLALSTGSFAKTPRPLVDVPIQTPEGKPILLKQYRGKVVILVIFSTECQDCVNVINFMSKLQEDYAARGFQVVGAAGDPTAKYTLGPFIMRYRPGFPIGYLDQAAIMRIADVPKGMEHAQPPIVLFIDRTGLVRFQYYGGDPFMRDPEKNFRGIATGLLNSSERRVVTAPKQPQ